ncbi:hypothetical protein [Legionella gresilensis]|uniref:hypothetical protein n=1 Tax=Legionella gresilensis TaxID=91823 RepID=UPI00104107F9|nr:hypothetical protein [Legionella gresilensis]
MSLKNLFPKLVKLVDLKIFQFHLEITHQVDDYTFQTKVYYPDVDLFQLSERYNEVLIKKIYAHIALSETFKYCSLFPAKIDFSFISGHLSQASLDFFLQTFQHAYAQCKYENGIGNEYKPIFVHGELLSGNSATLSIQNSQHRQSLNSSNTILVGNGGGKDSFLAMKLLEQSQLKYSVYQWTRPEYGRSQYQHELCAKLLQHTSPFGCHKVSVYDDFTESPFMQLYYPHLKGSFTLGIPECLFEALPVMLFHHQSALCFANEKSSDTGNLYWEGIQGVVNHQWVKSLEAELFFQEFITQFLISDFKFFSILKPIYDYRIFSHLANYPQFIKNSHSCNIDKPWCKKCPKCAYVWLGYLAHFDKSLVDAIFGTNPFDDEDLFIHYKNMTGIEGHRSFECIGNIEECQLFMKKCVEKGLQGKMLEIFKREVMTDDKNWDLIEEQFNQVHKNHNIPEQFFKNIKEFI